MLAFPLSLGSFSHFAKAIDYSEDGGTTSWWWKTGAGHGEDQTNSDWKSLKETSWWWRWGLLLSTDKLSNISGHRSPLIRLNGVCRASGELWGVCTLNYLIMQLCGNKEGVRSFTRGSMNGPGTLNSGPLILCSMSRLPVFLRKNGRVLSRVFMLEMKSGQLIKFKTGRD